MRKVVRRRLVVTLLFLGGFATTAYLVLDAFKDNLVFFMTPTELHRNVPHKNQKIRLGGQIKKGSIKVISAQKRQLSFVVTDHVKDVTVFYEGFLPDLFREGQGVVAEGEMNHTGGFFQARRLLAKHDETYRPPEKAADAQNQHGQGSLKRNS